MKHIILLMTVIFMSAIPVVASDCADNAKIVAPQIAAKTRTLFEQKLAAATKDFVKNPNDATATIWLGRRTAYLGKYKQAIDVYNIGIKNHPEDARLLRHRAHRYLSIRCFDDAIKDFSKAAELIKGKPDQVEPDGLPNAKNTPTSTLQSNIWYHLGLAQYLKRDFKAAVSSYEKGIEVSKNPDMLVAMTNWLYVAQRRAGLEKEAAKTLKTIVDGLELIENDGYYKMIKLYQGKISEKDMVSDEALQSATMKYGIGNWLLINGKKKEAMKVFKEITSGNQWSSFGYIAAERELKKR